MAKAKAKAKEAPATEEKKGRGVTLPNGEKRSDYIRDRFYNDGISRGDITREINEMLENAGRGDEKIVYQIVFAATKEEKDPRIAQAERKAQREKEKQEKAEAEAKAAKEKESK